MRSDHGWVVGEEGAILYTPDAGESWINVGHRFPGKLRNVVFVTVA